MKSLKLLTICALAATTLVSCGAEDTITNDFSTIEQPIIGGKVIACDEQPSLVSIAMGADDERANICTGVMIAEDWVLTAASCFKTDPCVDANLYQSFEDYMATPGLLSAEFYVGCHNRERVDRVYAKHIYTHPDYDCKDGVRTNDIALVQLKESFPGSIALVATSDMEPTYDEISEGISATFYGTGGVVRGVNKAMDKFNTRTLEISAYCPLNDVNSSECGIHDMEKTGLLRFYDEGGIINYHRGIEDDSYYDRLLNIVGRNADSDDSGAPVYITRDGKEYLIGINSSTPDHGKTALVTHINSFRDFIAKYVPNITNEICDDGVDNNKDGLADCKDPLCSRFIGCQPEICDNKIDDNGDGLVDCADPQCQTSEACSGTTEEIYIDCSDIPCDTPDGFKSCGEVCVKNFGKGYKAWCDGYDNIYCDSINPGVSQTNRGDLNDNAKVEICNDGIDNNDDGLIDCKDPACANTLGCVNANNSDNTDNNDSSCSATPLSSSNPFAALLAMLGAAGLLGLRRRKSDNA